MPTDSTDPVTIESLHGSRDDVRILKITGSLTLRNFAAFQEASWKDTSALLLIDLANVPYLDSAALGCLLGLHVVRERARRKYAIVQVPERLEKLFTVCGAREVLITFPTAAAAEAALLSS